MIRRLLASMLIALALGAWLAPAVSAEPRTFVARLEPSCAAAEEAGARGIAVVRLEDDGTLTPALSSCPPASGCAAPPSGDVLGGA